MKLLLSFILLIASFALNAQSEKEILDQADQLIQTQQYESAFQVLDKSDPDNQSIEPTILKVDILLKYYVATDTHRVFWLKDLNQDETLDNYRGNRSLSNRLDYDIESILQSLINRNESKCKLYKALAEFYKEKQLIYEPSRYNFDGLNQKLQVNYKKVIEGKCADKETYLNAFTISTSLWLYDEIVDFKTVRSYNPDNPYLLFAEGCGIRGEEKMQYWTQSFEKMGNPYLKAAIAETIIREYRYEHHNKIADYKYYKAISDINPFTADPILMDLSDALHTNLSEAKKMLSLLLKYYIYDKAIMSDIGGIFTSMNKENELLHWLTPYMEEYQNDPVKKGMLYFCLGKSYMHSNTKKAAQFFIKARDLFQTNPPEDRTIQKNISYIINQIEK